MTTLGGSIEALYGAHSGLYAALADDRDFAAQCRFLADEVCRKSHGARFLELFAGPARHAGVLRREHGATAVAIDASLDMKRLAVAAGEIDDADYHVVRLPQLPSRDDCGGAFDGAAILRFSVGYLTPLELGKLFANLSSVLRPGGRVAVELHDLSMVRSNFEALCIRKRIIDLGGDATLECTWPAGPLRWQADDWVVEMDVALRRLQAGREIEVHDLVSVERIYARSEIVALAAPAGLGPVTRDPAHPAFAGARLLLLERA